MQAAAFPSVTWFEGLAGAMARRHDGCEALGPLELTLVVRVLYPEGHDRLIAVEFRDGRCVAVTAPADLADVANPHAAAALGAYRAMRSANADVPLGPPPSKSINPSSKRGGTAIS